VSVRTVRTAEELAQGGGPGPRAVVMTMGALHQGHAALIRAAREYAGAAGTVVVTVFVNPLQFGAGEDLDRYPRTLEADLELAAAAGADVVFAPPVEEVYPGGEPQVRLSAGPMGTRFEGAVRPGHFDGMLTVVAKLLHLIRRMAQDLNFPVRIVGVPTVREPDGLALSSRNRFLSAADRAEALALSRALFAGRDAAAGGPAAVREAAAKTLAGTAAGTGLDYLALIDPADFTEVDREDFHGEAVLALAAKIGTTRLIDNVRISL
jgi:pantoate--beta-alanine ligase